MAILSLNGVLILSHFLVVFALFLVLVFLFLAVVLASICIRALTDVVVVVLRGVVVPLVEDDLFHPERLLHGRVRLVHGVLPQDHREAPRFGAGSETRESQQETCQQAAAPSSQLLPVRLPFPPVREAVGRREHPAGRDQTPPAAEHLLLGPSTPEYGSDPRVGLHSGNGSSHDLQLLSPGAQATCRLCGCIGGGGKGQCN